jgi:putative ABC transport system permease protein
MRSPKRTASSASTLMIGIGVVTTILVFAASLTKTFEGQLAQLLRSNYVVTDATGFLGFPTKVAELLAEVPGVQEVVPYRQNAFRAFGEDQQVSGIDGALIGDVLDVGEVRGDLAALAEPDTVAVSRQVAEDEGLDLGDTIAATFPEGERRLRVVAVYEETTPLGSYTIGFEQFRQRFPAFDNDQFAFAKADDGGDPAALQERVDRALFDYPTASFKSNAQFRDDQIGQFQQFLVLVYALLVLSLVIALFGIANTLALSVFERTREIGLMRAVGMDRDQTRGVVRWEGIIVSLLGALVGVLVGVGFGVALVNAASSQDNPLSLSVPPDQLVLVAFMAIVFGLLASLLAGRRAARLDVLDAIATE